MRKLLVVIFLITNLAPVLLFGQSNNIPPNMEHTYWNFIRAKILPPNAKAYRFKKDIRVKLKGNFTHKDSIFIRKSVVNLKSLLSTVNIELSDSSSNIVLTLIDGPAGNIIHNFYGLQKNGTITSQEYQFSLDGYSQNERNTCINYYLIRSLSEKQHNPNGDTGMPPSIFDVDNAIESEFTDTDKFLISNLYSIDFYDKFKSNYTGSKLDYYYYSYGNNIRFYFKIIAIILGFLSFLLLLRSGIINTETSNRIVFVKQGLLTINLILFFFLISQSFSSFRYITQLNIFKIFLCAEILLIVELFCLHLIESKFSNRNIFYRLILQAISTSLLIYLFFISYSHIITFVHSGKIYWQWHLNFEQITILVLAVCFRLIFNFSNFKNIQEIRVRDMELSKLKLLKTKAELQSLHSRINPHFLYNSLNSIATLTHINPAKTEEMALALSDFFRYAINHKNQDMIEIEKEVEIVQTYLQIEKVRFGENLEFHIEIDDSILNKLVPRFLIQPLIENSIKHGISEIQDKGVIKLEIRKLSDQLNIRVHDNGPDFPNTPISGYGLQSLYEKLELIYGKSAKITWQNHPDKNICLSLPISQKPLQHEN